MTDKTTSGESNAKRTAKRTTKTTAKTGRPAGRKETKPRPGKGESKVESRLNAYEKAKQAARLRTMRVSWDTIADRVGYSSRGAAYNAVQREIKRIPREAVNELRNVELESLDALEQAAIRLALAGNLGAIDRVLRIKELRGKYTGVFEAPSDTGVDEVRTVLTAWRAALVSNDSESDELAARLSADTGERHTLDDVAREFDVDLDESDA